jgi:hypothetical protein
MNPISKNDARFLIALNASEESSINDLRQDISGWDTSNISIVELIKELIDDGTVLFSNRENASFSDCTLEESLFIANEWQQYDSYELFIYLTDSGWLRWDTDDWGISSSRAKELIFSNKKHVSAT